MWETGTPSEGVSGRIWVEMGLQCLWAVFGNFTPFEGVGFRRSGEVGQNGAGDGLTFGRWDDIAGKLRTFGRWERAEWKGNAATGSVGHMARKHTFGRWEEIVGNCLTFGRWDEYGWRTVACGTRAESWARSRKVGGVRWIGGPGCGDRDAG